MTELAIPTLEQLTQQFADALIGERACRWEAGDIVAKALELNPGRKARLTVLGIFAELGHCTRAYARQLAEVSAAFGTEYRKSNVAWSLYRSCAHAEKRLQRPARDILTEALEKNFHVAEVNALGQPRKRTLSLQQTCPACGTMVHVRVKGASAKTFQGLVIRCPICAEVAVQDGRDAREAEQLGALA